METAIQIYDFEGHDLRIITEPDGSFLFLASDVCTVLEYTKSTSQVIKTHCKPEGVLKRYTPTSSGYQEMVYVTEPNLYRLMMKSKQVAAVKFEKKVMEEILPSLRKSGKYEIASLSDADIMNRAFLIATKQNEVLTLENSELKAQREADKPKLENHDAILNTESVFSLDEAGKSLGISGIKLKKLLKQTRFFTDKGLPYQKYINEKLFKVIPEILSFDGSVYMKTWVTGKGLDLLVGWFKTVNDPRKKKGLI